MGLRPGDLACGRYATTVDGIHPPTWERLVFDFDDATYDQTHAYAARLWGDGRLSHVVLRRDDAVVAAAQVVLLRLPLLGSGLAYVKFGPLWRRKGRSVEPEILSAMLDALQTEYAGKRGLLLTVVPPPDAVHHDLWHERLRTAGFRQRRRMVDPNRYLVDLSIDGDEQYRSLNQKWRYNLNKALTSDLRMRRVEGVAGVDAFDALYRRLLARKRFADGSIGVRALPAMLANLPPAMHPRVYLGELEGRPAAGAVVGLIGGTAEYLFGATDERALPSRAGYALQWWIVGQLHGAARWYDLGGEAGEPGLRQFKKGLVGKSGTITPLLGEFDFWTSGMGRLAGDAVFAARSARYSARQFSRKHLGWRYGANSGVSSQGER